MEMFQSLFCGLFWTCGMQNLGIIHAGIIGKLEKKYRLILGE